MNASAKWITRTAALLAILLVVQVVTKSGGQLFTGSCVNLILTVAVLACGRWSGIVLAVVSPFFAFLLGIGTPVFPIVPVIACGNLAFVLLLCALFQRIRIGRGIPAAAVAAAGKAFVLYLLVVRVLLPVLALPEQQTAALSASFSSVQLITALIGGILGVLIVPIIRRALYGSKA